MMQRLTIVFTLCCFAYACETDNNYSVIPEITFLEYELRENDMTDTILLTFEYLDGDGDLGLRQDENSLPGNPEIKNVIFIDYFEKYGNGPFKRVIPLGGVDSLRYPYTPPLLTPKGQKTAIRGEITATIDIYPLPLDTTKEIKYSIYMYDRAGNKSNVIESPSITYSTPEK